MRKSWFLAEPIAYAMIHVGLPDRIEVGDTLAAVLEGAGAARAYDFAVEEDRLVTVSVESFDFDAVIRIETAASAKVAEDDNGGVETNARVVLEAKAGVRYRLVVAAAGEGAGEFSLSVAAGEAPRPAGATLLDAAIEFRAKAADRALARGDKKAAARHRFQEGYGKYSRSQFAEAKVAYEASLSLARESGDREAEAAALGSLGNVDRSLGDYPKARERLEQVLALFRELGDRAGEAKALGNIGLVYSSLGDHLKAREHQQKHLAIAQELGDREDEAWALVGLGMVFHSFGDYPKARELLEQVLTIHRELGNRKGEATAIGNLGIVFHSLGDYPRAREHYERWLALSRELGDRKGEARALANLGIVFYSLEDYPKARDHFEQVLALFRELGDRGGEARTLGNLGNVHLSLGDLPKAREQATQAIASLEDLSVEEGLLYPLATLARSALAEGEAAGARQALAQALPLLERPSSRSLEIAERAGLRSRFTRWGEIAQDLAALEIAQAEGVSSAQRARAEGFAAAGRWKGRALLEGIAEHRSGGRFADAIDLRRHRGEALARREGVLERISKAIREGRPAGEVDTLREEARLLLTRAEDLSAELREVSPRDAALDLSLGIGPEVLRPLLGRGAALIEYAEGQTRLHAYLVADGGLSFFDLGDRGEIGEAVERFLSAVKHPDRRPDDLLRSGERLYERLLAPVLEGGGAGVDRLVLAPTPSLATLPFEALVVDAKGPGPARSLEEARFVLDRFEVCYAPSSPVLAEIASLGERPSEGKVLVLADPVYPSEPGAGDPASVADAIAPVPRGAARSVPEDVSFSRLPRTRDEALALARLLLDPTELQLRRVLESTSIPRSLSLSGRRFALHLGERATLHRLPVDLREYSIVHLAAHGYVDGEEPQRTGIALSHREGEDGFLAIADVLELDLDAELVVLSACATAQGEVTAGEGVESLARSFLYAGARAVVASLWQVSDAAAARTMEGFYRGALEGGRPWPSALREAKLAVRRARVVGEGERGVAGVSGRLDSAHPFFWAPFIYIGPPR